MDYPDENDLPDAAIKAMWDEGELVELADRATPRVEITPSPWSLLATTSTVRGLTMYFAYLSAATGPYRMNLDDAGRISSASVPA